MGKLHEAAKKGDVAEIRKLIKGSFFRKAIDVNEQDEKGQTALDCAALMGHVDVIRCLVKEFGADVDAIGINGHTALHKAAWMGKVDAIRCLVKEFGAKVDILDNDGMTPFDHAAWYRRVDAIRYLVKECGVNVNTIDKDGYPYLHRAAMRQHIDVIRCLVKECGADANFVSKNMNGGTILHLVAMSGYVEATRCLVKDCGVDVNIRDNDGNTPLHQAALLGSVEVVWCLVHECGADVTIPNKNGKRPYEVTRNAEIQQLLPALPSTYQSNNNISIMKNKNTFVSTAVSPAPAQSKSNTSSNENKNQIIQPQTTPSLKDLLQTQIKQGETLLQQEKYVEAEACFDEALQLDENDIESWYGKGKALLLQDIFDQALECFEQTLILLPSHFDACYIKVKILLHQGKEQDALNCYDIFLKHQPNHVDALKAKVALLANQNNKQAMLSCYNDFLKHNPHELDILQAKIALLLEQGAINDALNCMDEQLKHKKIQKNMFELKGLLLRYAKYYPEAVTHYTNALEHFANDETLMCLMGNTYLQQKQIIKAELLFNKVLKQNPTSSLALQGKALAELNKNKKESAQNYFAQAEKAANGSLDALAILYFERGQVYQTLGMQTEAQQCYETVLQHDANHAFAKLCLAQLKVSPKNSSEIKVPSVSASIENNSSNSNDNNNIVTPSPRASKPVVSSFSIAYSQIKIGTKIGEGGFGMVYQGVWSNTDVAIKQLKNGIVTSKVLDEFNHEVELMAHLRHKHIVQLYGAVTEKEPFCMVMEYMSGGSLYRLLQSSISLSWQQRETIALDIAKGLDYLHEHKILHRDLKSLNVLLDEHHTAKLADFGLAKIKADTSHSTQTHGSVAGSFAWMAPELFSNENCTKASDMWSYGMVVWEITSRTIPFKNAQLPYMTTCILTKDEPEPIPTECKQQSPKLAHLIQFCWQKDKTKRATTSQVIEHLQKPNDDFVSHDSYYASVQSVKQSRQEEDSYVNVKSFGGKKN